MGFRALLRSRRTSIKQKPELLSKLETLYGGTEAKRDVFGRRDASPHEIERSLAKVRRRSALENEG